jgi:hypothetical protein
VLRQLDVRRELLLIDRRRLENVDQLVLVHGHGGQRDGRHLRVLPRDHHGDALLLRPEETDEERAVEDLVLDHGRDVGPRHRLAGDGSGDDDVRGRSERDVELQAHHRENDHLLTGKVASVGEAHVVRSVGHVGQVATVGARRGLGPDGAFQNHGDAFDRVARDLVGDHTRELGSPRSAGQEQARDDEKPGLERLYRPTCE